MAGPFPCPNPPVPCETSPNPATGFSSEATDSTTFIGLAWSSQPPPLNKPINLVPCEGIADSQVSQADADRIAQNAAILCAAGCSTPFVNTAQTATGRCADGSVYSLTVPAGLYLAENQVLADRKAFTAAVEALSGHSICLGSLAPLSICWREFYFGIITVVTTDAPASIVMVQGDLPDGLSITFESSHVVVQGTPTSLGTFTFSLMATSAAGVVTSKSYSVSVNGIVTGSTLTPGNVGVAYSVQLNAVTVSAPVWSVVSGTLPNGITLNAATGQLSGDPTTVGASSFTIGVTADGQTCTKDFSLNVSSSGPVCIVQYATLPIPGNISGEASSAKDAATRRIAVSIAGDNKITFVNSATNAIIQTTNVPNLSLLNPVSRGDFAAFATSTKEFYVTVAATVVVFDSNGNTITSIAMGNTGQSACVYSPTQDRVYVRVFDPGTGTCHFLVINPHTHTIVNDVDTGNASSGFIFYAPTLDQIVVESGNLVSWQLSTMTQANSLAFHSNTEIDYAPNIGKWFASSFNAIPIKVIDGASLTITGTITPLTFTGPTAQIKYNPVYKTIIAFSVNGEIAVIDTTTLTIICELADADQFSGAISIDYSSGDDYLLDWNGGLDPLLIYH